MCMACNSEPLVYFLGSLTRRFTRLTNAFSKMRENHWAAVACWFAFYSFRRVHKSLRITPDMAAGIADHV
jgi:hypothetical protein